MAEPSDFVFTTRSREPADTQVLKARVEAAPVFATRESAPTVATAHPLSLFTRAAVPAIVAALGMIFLVAVVPQYPNLNIIGGQPVPVEIAAPGTVLAKVDTATRSSDYSFTFPAGLTTTTMIVWDYAAEDGDMVSVLAGGASVSPSFTIFHAPKVIRVPVGSEVRVIGTHDGGGGITYAVSFPDIGKSVVNGIAPGDTTIFKLLRGTSSAGGTT